MPTARETLQQFTAMLDLVWVGRPAWDVTTVYGCVAGDVIALPGDRAVASVYQVAGFDRRVVASHKGMQRFSGRRGRETLSCTLLAPLRFRGKALGGAKVTLEWRSGEHPPIVGGEVQWRGRVWPTLFADPCLYFESSELLIVEGTMRADGLAACVSGYRDWAAANGFSRHEEYEADLAGDGGFANGDFVVTVTERAAFVTLSVRLREQDDV